MLLYLPAGQQLHTSLSSVLPPQVFPVENRGQIIHDEFNGARYVTSFWIHQNSAIFGANFPAVNLLPVPRRATLAVFHSRVRLR